MFKKVLTSLAAALILTASANAAHVVSLNVVPPADDGIIDVGDQFTVDILGNFQDLGLLAGGLQVLYDAAFLQVDDFQFALAVDTDLSCPGANLCPNDPPGTLSIVWGQFLADLIAPGAGETLMGTITMTALQATGAGRGSGTAINLVDFSQFTGGWFGAGFVSIDAPALNGTSVSIVPLPAAVWMMIGGLGALARFRRK